MVAVAFVLLVCVLSLSALYLGIYTLGLYAKYLKEKKREARLKN